MLAENANANPSARQSLRRCRRCRAPPPARRCSSGANCIVVVCGSGSIIRGCRAGRTSRSPERGSRCSSTGASGMRVRSTVSFRRTTATGGAANWTATSPAMVRRTRSSPRWTGSRCTCGNTKVRSTRQTRSSGCGAQDDDLRRAEQGRPNPALTCEILEGVPDSAGRLPGCPSTGPPPSRRPLRA